jgi:signal peptidase I
MTSPTDLPSDESREPDPSPDVPAARPERAAEERVIPVGERTEPYDARQPAENTLPRHRIKKGSFLRELPILVLIAVVLALLIKTFLVQAFYIPSGSMEQTLHINDRVLVNKVVYHLRDPHRGEIVVFDTKGTGFDGQGDDFNPCPQANGFVNGVRVVQRFLGVGGCGDSDFIKRVIAVPGDTVQCCTNQGKVIVNGKPLTEKYVYQDNEEPFCAAPPGDLEHKPDVTGAAACGPGAKPVVVTKGNYWVMGDHRSASDDSRPNGFVPGKKIVGRAFVRVWPISRWGFLSVPKTTTAALSIGATPVVSAPLLLIPVIGGRLGWRRRRRHRAALGRRLAERTLRRS